MCECIVYSMVLLQCRDGYIINEILCEEKKPRTKVESDRMQMQKENENRV